MIQMSRRYSRERSYLIGLGISLTSFGPILCHMPARGTVAYLVTPAVLAQSLITPVAFGLH